MIKAKAKCFQCKKEFDLNDLYHYLRKDNPYDMKKNNAEWKAFREKYTELFCMECIRGKAK